MSEHEEEARRKRAEARRADSSRWRIRRYDLGSEPEIDPDDPMTMEERVACVWPLSVSMWRLAGRELPTYTRNEIPGRVIRGGQKP